MQAAAELVVLVGELAAGVQRAEDDLYPGHTLLRVDIHRHAAAVVGHRDRAIAVQDHVDLAGMAGQGLVDAVVDDFLGQVVGAGGVGVHARALAHGLESGQDLNVFGGVIAHR